MYINGTLLNITCTVQLEEGFVVAGLVFSGHTTGMARVHVDTTRDLVCKAIWLLRYITVEDLELKKYAVQSLRKSNKKDITILFW